MTSWAVTRVTIMLMAVRAMTLSLAVKAMTECMVVTGMMLSSRAQVMT